MQYSDEDFLKSCHLSTRDADECPIVRCCEFGFSFWIDWKLIFWNANRLEVHLIQNIHPKSKHSPNPFIFMSNVKKLKIAKISKNFEFFEFEQKLKQMKWG